MTKLRDGPLSLAAIISFVGLFVDLSDIEEQCFEFRKIFIFRKLLFGITQLYDFKLKAVPLRSQAGPYFILGFAVDYVKLMGAVAIERCAVLGLSYRPDASKPISASAQPISVVVEQGMLRD
jgi:hypothetical protein